MAPAPDLSERLPKGEKAAPGAKKRLSIANPLAALGMRVKTMLESLPERVEMMQRTEDSLRDPLWRCFDREMGFGKDLLKKVRADLDRLHGACNATVKTTNDIRMLIQDMQTDAIPKGWRKYIVADITVTEWLADFNLRLSQLQQIRDCSNLQRFTLVWRALLP